MNSKGKEKIKKISHPTIICDEARVDEVLARGVEAVLPDKIVFRKLLLSGRRIRLYCGFDPSADALHIGNAIALNKLAQFQALGHEVIFLIGDFTGMIGDPTDKSSARSKLTREQVLGNAKNYREQASAYLKFDGENPALIKYNSIWSDPLTFKDLIELSSNFTVQQMIQRDMFQERIKQEKPIFLHEFLYPLAQGYDSVAMDVDLEVGGNDQMFNMMCGRDLMKALGKKEKYVMTLKLLADDSGKKMGKSEGNVVSLDAMPADMYGAVMSWSDGAIGLGLELATKLPLNEVRADQVTLKAGQVNPRDLKMKLARTLVTLVHGHESAAKAEQIFINTFQKKEIPSDMAEISLGVATMNIVELLVVVKLAASKSEARRLITQGGIKVGTDVMKDPATAVVVPAKGVVIQKGKRYFVRVKK
jgi:tyrosyl-tRNA synthetase